MSETLPGRRALVTGASRGIGRALALELAARGVEVWASARGADDLEKLETEARGLDGRLICAPVDLESDDSIAALVDSVLGAGPELDLLVHSAGVLSMGAVADAPVADLDRQYRINVRAVYLLTQGLLDAIAKGRGQIVFLNSSAGIRTPAEVGAYGATKHALRGLADALRHEVNKKGIRVLSVYPGRTATDMQRDVHAFERRTYREEALVQPQDVADVIVHAVELPPTAEVTDIHVRPLQKF